MRAGQSRGAIILAGAVLSGLLLALAQPARASSEEATLETLCNDKPVSLTKISATRKLIEASRSLKSGGEQEACSKYADSLIQLDDILATVQTGKICDLGFVDKIRTYHVAFIADSSNRARDNIPRALRHFFISLCFQISAECKMALINNLEYDTKDKITDADYDQIKFLEAHGATLLDQEAQINDFDDILLLDDLNESSAGLKEETGESKLLIKVRTNKMMRKLVENCNNKFKPFYDKLILPLIKLSNLGYNYQGELLEREMEELRRNALVLRWYNIVQTCEAFRTIEIFEDPEPSELADGVQALTFISSEMAQSLRNNNVKTIEQEIQEDEKSAAAAAASGASGDAGATLVYEPIASHNDDELWIKDQRELEKLVHKYKASLSEADRVKSKLFKKIVRKVKSMILSGQVPMLASELIKSQFGEESKKTTSVNEDLVMMMDEAVREDEIKSGLASPDDLDAPVAGFSKASGARKVVSRAGYVSKVQNMATPGRTKLVPFTKNGTKLTTRLKNFGSSFLPSRMNIFAWILAITGTLMLIIAILAG